MNPLNRKLLTMTILVLGLAIGLPLAAFSADVSGVVSFDGKRPGRKRIRMGADVKCEAIHIKEDGTVKKVGTENLIVSKSLKIRNAFVYVKDGLPDKKFDPPEKHAKIDQKGCVYKPHVQGIVLGQVLDIVNSDSLMHNIHALPKINREFNKAQPAPGTMEEVFRKAEMAIKFKCDVHPCMGAWVHVMEHPFFDATSSKGKFKIKGLSNGDYTLAVWHEVLGEQELKITVTDAGVTDADFTFKEKK